jgi:tetratricopeptide (TPR) repeat protein
MDNRKARKYYMEGTALALVGKFGQAIDTLSKAIAIEPMYIDAHLHRGIARIDNGESEKALEDLDFVIREDAENALAFYNRSLAYMELGKIDQALPDMNQAVRLAPNDVKNYINRCVIHSLREEYEAAIDDATKAIELGGAKDGNNNLAVIFEKKGDYKQAIVYWTRVLNIDPNDSKALCHRGILFDQIGEQVKAVSDLKNGLKNKNKLTGSLKVQSEELLNRLKKLPRK